MRRYTRSFVPREWHCRLNIIPLIDILFMLMMFFIMTAQLITVTQEPVQLPAPSPSQGRVESYTERLVVNLLADSEGKLGKIRVNAQVVKDLPALADLLLRLGPRVRGHGTAVVLRADRRIAFAEIQPVLRALSNSAVGSLEVATVFERPAAEREE